MGRTTWPERWKTLRDTLIKPGALEAHFGDEDDAIGAQLDLGGYSRDVLDARFGDKDLVSQGGLPGGQFGEIDVALCRLDNALYVRKAQPRRQALQATRERDVLLRARRTGSVWSPHLLCAFKEGTGAGGEGPLTYTLVMSYVPGGTLEDVLESCTDGGLAESDVRWWFSQAISAIGWLHDQGWAHRDIKPSNLAITSTKHLQVLDFGCAAPISLSAARKPGSPPHRVLPYDDCLVPCGTCDYLSPEILIWHENALARARKGYDDEEEEEDTWAQDFSEDIRSKVMDKLRRSVNSHGDTSETEEGYGPETDWWSLGAMIYELAYGTAPFFAQDVPTTYKKVLAHNKSLRFPAGVVSSGLEAVLARLLTNAEQRLGRNSVKEIQDHSYFRGVEWDKLHMLSPPLSLVTPQFTYAPPVLDESAIDASQEQGGFAFSAFFQSTVDGSNMVDATGIRRGGNDESRRLTLRQGGNESRKLTLRPGGTEYEEEEPMEQLGGFSWGPPVDAFDHMEHTIEPDDVTEDVGGLMANTPFRLKVPATPFSYNKATPFRQPLFGLPSATPLRQTSATPFRKTLATPFQYRQPAATPFRQSSATPFYPNPAGGSHRPPVSATPFRTPFRQPVAGPDQTYRSSAAHMFKTPVRPGALAYSTGNAGPSTGTGTGTARRTRAVTEAEALRQVLESARKRVYLGGEDSKITLSEASRSVRSLYAQAQDETENPPDETQDDEDQVSKTSRPSLHPIVIPMFDDSMTSSDGVGVPPSPSPSPRPGSALSRRSATPSAMMALGALTPSAMYSRSGSRLSVRATTPTWTGRARRDESEEDLLEDKERRERAEKHRRAILDKERERARKEELARLERQKEKGKGREQDDVDETQSRELSSLRPRQPSRSQERPKPVEKEPETGSASLLRKDTPDEGPSRTNLERQAQVKLEQERRRLEKKREARRKDELAQRDQEVEAARLQELALAEEMARRDEAKRRDRVRSNELVPAIRVDRNGEREQPREKAGGAQPAPALESTARRRVKSVNALLSHAGPSSPPVAQENRLDVREEPRRTDQAPSLRARTRSHEPLRPSTTEPERPRPRSRVTLDDVAGRQQSLVQDVDALQERIKDALRMLQAGQT